jgi:hypothetical protein
LKLVQSKKNNDVLMDATTTLRSIKEILDFNFKEKKEFDVKEILKNVAKGNPIAKGNVGSTESFIVELQCQFDLAKGKGEEAIFEKKSTYVDIMNAKLPYSIKNWTRKFKTGQREVNFREFITFVLDEAMMEEEMATNARTESRAPKVTRQRGNETMGPFASGHPDASTNDRMQEQRRPRSDDSKSAGCKIHSEEHQVAKNFW